MEPNQNHQPANVPQSSEPFGIVPNRSETFRTLPNASESFGNIPHDSARFGNVPHHSERKENHTLTVREAARMFEAAGVARTERSIVNWCQPNRTGIARLDSYFDPNERKYFISPQSAELAIAEEKAKAAKNNEPAGFVEPVSESFRIVPQSGESFRTVPKETTAFPNASESGEIKELEHQIRDLQITNKAKDMVIEQMQKERNGFFEQVISANRKMGELEARLLQLEPPNEPK